jgi:TatD DNase family protein
MIDAHCHLQFEAYESDYDAVINNAFAAGITAIITTGTQLSSSIAGVNLAERYDQLYAVIGVHPHHADKIQGDYWLKELEKLIKHPKVIGIGEIGLDYHAYKTNGIVDPKIQKSVFISQLELAHQAKLPLQIHNRHAGEDIINVLKEQKHLLQNNPGMFHCFAGTKEVLHDALALGFSIGFDGNSTYKGLASGETVLLSEIALATPLDRMVIETDSPYLTPVPHRGERNKPEYAMITARFLATLKNVSYETLVEQTDKNVYTLFSL